MATIPKYPGPGSRLALTRVGHDFTRNRCQHYRSDLFQTRFLLQQLICLGRQQVPDQDLQNRLLRLPTLPWSGFVTRRVKTTR